MKKVFLTAAFAFTLATFAATSITNKVKAENNIFQEKQYKAISNDKIAAPVSKEIAEKYEGYAITSAAVAGDGEYKIILGKDGKNVTVYYKSDGEFVKEQKA